MRKIKFIVAILMFICICGLFKVEAATVAIMPLLNKAEFAAEEEEKLPGQLYFDVALDVLKNKPGYMLIDNDRLHYAIKINTTPNTLPTKEQLQTIAKKANVDILVAMELNKYGRKRFNRGVNEITMQMDIRGKLVIYNRLTGKYVLKKCEDTSCYDGTMESRYDKVKEAWINLVRREFNRLTSERRK
ncbi:MAG: hypothetical protein KBS60_07095 [Phascolarctobacterium sp.]|nr:hypothetical protein [Candidatus Phascolarctobacterium caballi]